MKISISLVFICFIFYLSSCFTLTGLGIGTIADDVNSGEFYTIEEKLFDINPNAILKVITVSNDTLLGQHLNTTNEYSDKYIVEYNKQFKELKNQFVVPSIGDTLLISNPLGDIYKYIFLGFDFKKIYVKSALSGSELFIKINSGTDIRLQNDRHLNLKFINNGIQYKTIPIMSKLHIKTKSDSISIYFNTIHSIKIESKHSTRFLMFAGMLIDLFLVYSIEKLPGPGGGEFRWRWE